jgi:hypothetical protein
MRSELSAGCDRPGSILRNLEVPAEHQRPRPPQTGLQRPVHASTPTGRCSAKVIPSTGVYLVGRGSVTLSRAPAGRDTASLKAAGIVDLGETSDNLPAPSPRATWPRKP